MQPTPRHKIAFRRLDGILLLDKPQGMSSNAALQAARRLFRAEKGGHTGSLDPLATGLLPLCFGEATKIAGLLLGSAKAYEAGIRLGVVTDTDDADGQVLRERPVPGLDTAAVRAALVPLTGRIRQRAPVYSALKQGGEPLYAKARRGEAISARRSVAARTSPRCGACGSSRSCSRPCTAWTRWNRWTRPHARPACCRWTPVWRGSRRWCWMPGRKAVSARASACAWKTA